MNDRIKRYVSLIVAASILSALVLSQVGPQVDAASIRAAMVLSVLAIAAQLLAHPLPSGGLGSVAFIPNLALIVLAPDWLSVSAIFVSCAITDIVSRRAIVKTLFNAAQFALAGTLSACVYLAIRGPIAAARGGDSIGTGELLQFAAVLVVAGVFTTANALAVSGVLALSENTPILRIWRKNLRKTVVYDVLASPAVYVLVWTYQRWGARGALASALPLLALRQLYHANSMLERVNRDLLELMVKAIEARDPYTSGHSRRVAHYSTIIARAVGMSSSEIERIAIAALLHNVGKIHEIYAPILRKPDKLNPGEWAVMQTHPNKSAELVGTVSHLKDIVAPVRHHHENWDGTGYPDGLAGENIPLGSRIVLFADTIDAMTTDRPYRKALSESQVRSELVKYRGKQFDPDMCDKLLASPMFGLLFAPNQRQRTPERTEPVRGSSREKLLAR